MLFTTSYNLVCISGIIWMQVDKSFAGFLSLKLFSVKAYKFLKTFFDDDVIVTLTQGCWPIVPSFMFLRQLI